MRPLLLLVVLVVSVSANGFGWELFSGRKPKLALAKQFGALKWGESWGSETCRILRQSFSIAWGMTSIPSCSSACLEVVLVYWLEGLYCNFILVLVCSQKKLQVGLVNTFELE